MYWVLYRTVTLHYNFSIIAAVYSVVEDLPPRSPVIVCPSATVYNTSDGGQQNIHHIQPEKNDCKHTERVAFSILSACSLRFMCLSIINEDNMRAVGLAKPLPNKKEKKYC